MTEHSVTIFKPYPFQAGQKINIHGGPRGGDWEVVEVSESKVKLRCPVTHKEVEWKRFCYVVEERQNEQWPKEGQ